MKNFIAICLCIGIWATGVVTGFTFGEEFGFVAGDKFRSGEQTEDFKNCQRKLATSLYQNAQCGEAVAHVE